MMRFPCMKTGVATVVLTAAAVLSVNPMSAVAQEGFENIEDRGPNIAVLEFNDLPVDHALRLMSEDTGMNLVASGAASNVEVSLYLRNVRALDAVDAMCKTNGLWYRRDDVSGIIRIFTVEEYQQDVTQFLEEEYRVWTLNYPNALDIAVAIQDLYGERVLMSLGIDDEERMDELRNRFDRFDLLDERGLDLNILGGRAGNTGGSSERSARREGSDFNTGVTRRSAADERAMDQRVPIEDLTPEEIAAMEGGPDADRSILSDVMRRLRSTIYVTVIRKHNQIVIRTGDKAALEEIESLVKTLDVPTAMVLLEVKILSIELGDGFDSVFDIQFSDGSSSSGGFTTGDILPPLSDTTAGSRRDESIRPEGSGLRDGDFTFQFVSDNFRARLQMLENTNRITVLATPLLLTANNEVSRIFVGSKDVPILKDFGRAERRETNNTIITFPGEPQYENEDVGTSLLITPDIHSDRTVTLRLLQETSEIQAGGATILVPSDASFESRDVDIVTARTVNTTVVAKDGYTIAIGGLIEESIGDSRAEVPILGKLPIIGILFRRQDTERTRRELVIMIRPYVLNTPAESNQISQDLMRELSIHPVTPAGRGTLGTYTRDDALMPEQPEGEMDDVFEFHGTQPRNDR